MHDTQTRMGHSLIQHGPFSSRIYLMKLDKRDLPGLPGRLHQMAHENGYRKIFCKIPRDAVQPFLDDGYHIEAVIPGFYQRTTDAIFLASFVDPDRAQEPYKEAIQTFDKALEIEPQYANAWVNKGHTLIELKQYEDALVALNNALELDPKNAYTWNNKGMALFYLKEYDNAILAYNEALEIEPKYSAAEDNRDLALNKREIEQ